MKSTFPLLCIILLFGCSSEKQQTVEIPKQQTSPAKIAEGLSRATPDASPSHSAPIDAVKSFYDGIFDGNIEQVKSALVMNDKVEEYLLANVNLVKAMNKFAKADREYFGEGGFPNNQMKDSMADKLANIKTTVIDENHAECSLGSPAPIKLVRSSLGWKIDFTQPESKQFLELAPKVFGNAANVFDKVREGILTGTISSRADCRKELGRLKRKQNL